MTYLSFVLSEKIRGIKRTLALKLLHSLNTPFHVCHGCMNPGDSKQLKAFLSGLDHTGDFDPRNLHLAISGMDYCSNCVKILLDFAVKKSMLKHRLSKRTTEDLV